MKTFLTMILLVIAMDTLFAQDTLNPSRPKALLNFNDQNPVFKLQNEQLSNKNGFMRYDVLTGYREGVSSISENFGLNFQAQIDHEKGTHRIKMYNLSIQDMLTHGLRKSNRIILEVKDPGKYRYHPDYGNELEWLRKNGYCYEMMMPIGVINSMQIVDDDLCRLFKVKIRNEKRMIDGKEREVLVISEQ